MKKMLLSTTLFSVLALGPFAASATVPTTLNFTARIADTGLPVTGTHNFTFTFYNVATAGTGVWTESQTGVTVNNGVVSLALGATTVIPPAIFAGGLVYLEVAFDGTTLSPRLPVLAAPYALLASNAEKFGGKTPAQYSLSCVGVFSALAVSVPAGGNNGASVGCPAAYPILTGGGFFHFVNNVVLDASYSYTSGGTNYWYAEVYNNNAFAINFYGHARCCVFQ